MSMDIIRAGQTLRLSVVILYANLGTIMKSERHADINKYSNPDC